VKILIKVTCCEPQLHFHVTYFPGPPHRLSFLSPSDGHISVPNGDILNSITLACLDEYGNRCAPSSQFGPRWYVKLDEKGPLSADTEKFAVQTDGLVTLDGLIAELDDVVSYPGVRIVQSLQLEWPMHLGVLSQQESIVKEELCVTVTPGTRPTSLEVWCSPLLPSICLPLLLIMCGYYRCYTAKISCLCVIYRLGLS
jgi:hypothetical protein